LSWKLKTGKEEAVRTEIGSRIQIVGAAKENNLNSSLSIIVITTSYSQLLHNQLRYLSAYDLSAYNSTMHNTRGINTMSHCNTLYEQRANVTVTHCDMCSTCI